jgi:hypothetical protein
MTASPAEVQFNTALIDGETQLKPKVPIRLTEHTILEANFEILAPLPSSDRCEVKGILQDLQFESRASASIVTSSTMLQAVPCLLRLAILWSEVLT